MKCSFQECDKVAVGKVYFPAIDRWDPLCAEHYVSHTKGGMKGRLLTRTQEEVE